MSELKLHDPHRHTRPERDNRMCTNATRRVDLDIINHLCQTFEVTPGELFEFTPEKKRKAG